MSRDTHIVMLSRVLNKRAMTERMNPPPLGEELLEELGELKRILGLRLQYEEDASPIWSEYLWSYAIKFYDLFYGHYSQFPDFLEQAKEAARHNAVITAVDVLKRQMYNFNSLRPSYENKIFERVSEHILREERKSSQGSKAENTNRRGSNPLPNDQDLASTRRAFVQRILDDKGWSILDWANDAGVAAHTTNDYMAGKTRPYPSTRAKLAKSLGVTIQQLPR